jgi:hypothetical protein
MARKQVAKKARNPEATESRRAENKPKSPRGMPRSFAGSVAAVMGFLG